MINMDMGACVISYKYIYIYIKFCCCCRSSCCNFMFYSHTIPFAIMRIICNVCYLYFFACLLFEVMVAIILKNNISFRCRTLCTTAFFYSIPFHIFLFLLFLFGIALCDNENDILLLFTVWQPYTTFT